MTGDELREARIGCKMSREELGDMLGVAAQVIGSWERLGADHIAMARPREAAPTRAAKEKLPTAMSFMTAVGAFTVAAGTGGLVPAPVDWLPVLSKGDPLVLTEAPAVEGDLVLLKDTAGQFSQIARVLTERDAGQLMCFVRPYKVMKLPDPDGYATIEYSLARQHTGIPDKVEWTHSVPPDLV